MTREEFAAKIHWKTVMWWVGIGNVGAMLPQLVRLIITHETAGLSLGMFWAYFIIQIFFSLHGFFNRDRMLMWCLGLSALVTATNITLVHCFR